jgi:hypothetical protein
MPSVDFASLLAGGRPSTENSSSAESALRGAVIYCKLSLGSQS